MSTHLGPCRALISNLSLAIFEAFVQHRAIYGGDNKKQ